MEAISITTERREGTGKGANRKLRATDRVPGILYGFGIQEPIKLHVDPKDMLKVFTHPKGLNAVIDLQVDGQGRLAMVREVQRHPVSRKLVHIDFIAPDPKREIEAEVVLTTSGTSPGVQAGGKLRTPRRVVKVRSVPEKIPASLNADVSKLELGDTMTVSQLPMPEGVVPVFDQDYVVAKVVAPRGGAAEGAAAAESAG
jgi:large subunit ribosomal protein L25